MARLLIKTFVIIAKNKAPKVYNQAAYSPSLIYKRGKGEIVLRIVNLFHDYTKTFVIIAKTKLCKFIPRITSNPSFLSKLC